MKTTSKHKSSRSDKPNNPNASTMSSSSQTPSPSLLFLVLAAVLFLPLVHSASRQLLRPSDPNGSDNYLGRKVGGRTEMVGVECNKEVQALGRFSVEEHNRRVMSSSSPAECLLAFRRVERAQSQVVAGIKYYLTVAVEGGAGRYDAEIVVRAWENSRELLSFTPASEDAGQGVVNGDGGCGGSGSKVQ